MKKFGLVFANSDSSLRLGLWPRLRYFCQRDFFLTATGELYQSFSLSVLLYYFFNPIVCPPTQSKLLALPPLHSLGPPMGGLAIVLFLFSYMFQYLPRLVQGTLNCPFGVALSFYKFLLSGVARFGGHSFSSAPALIFSLLSRVVGGNLLRRIAPIQKHNRSKWWKLADSNTEIQFSLHLATNTGVNLFQNKTLRYCTKAKHT